MVNPNHEQGSNNVQSIVAAVAELLDDAQLVVLGELDFGLALAVTNELHRLHQRLVALQHLRDLLH